MLEQGLRSTTMHSIPLSDIKDCFEGVIPSIIATTDADGLPNVSFLSQVTMVDEEHIALSNQFFSKTIQNVQATGSATLLVVDARYGHQFVLELEFLKSEYTGELFERMSTQIQAIGGQVGLGHVMALRSADIYKVATCRKVSSFQNNEEAKDTTGKPTRMAAVARLITAVAQSTDADAMIDIVLDGLLSEFGFQSAMVLVPDSQGEVLSTLSSRGYDSVGTGSEIKMGEGIIGLAATQHRPIRISDMSRGRRIIDAVRATLDLEQKRIVPLPGLENPQSQIAAPMLSQNQFFGVLFAESETRFSFTSEDEDALGAIAGHLATSLRMAEVDSRETDIDTAEPYAIASSSSIECDFELKYYEFDDSVFINGEYIIKGVPGRLLMHFLTHFVTSGKSRFSNREIRRDQSLRLPELKDNLETRLILLRRRLEEKDAPISLLRPERGRIQLDVRGTPKLETVPGS